MIERARVNDRVSLAFAPEHDKSVCNHRGLSLLIGVQAPCGSLHRVQLGTLPPLPACRALRRSASRKRFSYHISGHIGETLVAAVATERQACVVETEQM